MSALDEWVAVVSARTVAHCSVVGRRALCVLRTRRLHAHWHADKVEAVAGLVDSAVLVRPASHGDAGLERVALRAGRAVALGLVQACAAFGPDPAFVRVTWVNTLFILACFMARTIRVL